jgi:hypothetical protein
MMGFFITNNYHKALWESANPILNTKSTNPSNLPKTPKKTRQKHPAVKSENPYREVLFLIPNTPEELDFADGGHLDLLSWETILSPLPWSIQQNIIKEFCIDQLDQIRSFRREYPIVPQNSPGHLSGWEKNFKSTLPKLPEEHVPMTELPWAYSMGFIPCRDKQSRNAARAFLAKKTNRRQVERACLKKMYERIKKAKASREEIRNLLDTSDPVTQQEIRQNILLPISKHIVNKWTRCPLIQLTAASEAAARALKLRGFSYEYLG